jgi:hypothetical protein
VQLEFSQRLYETQRDIEALAASSEDTLKNDNKIATLLESISHISDTTKTIDAMSCGVDELVLRSQGISAILITLSYVL